MHQMNLVRYLHLLGLLIICISSSGADRESQDDPKYDWIKPHYKLYASEGEPLGVSQTLELIKSLIELYEGQSDSGSKARRQRLDALLEISKVSPLKCKRAVISNYVELIKKHSPFKINVIPYLHHYFAMQYNICKGKFDNSFKSLIGMLNELYRRNIDDLMNLITVYSPKYQPFPEINPAKGLSWVNNLKSFTSEYLTEAIFKFIEKNCGRENVVAKYNEDPERGQNDLNMEFEYLLVDACDNLINELSVHSKLYMPFMEDQSLRELLDPLVAKWMEKVKVCKDITESKKLLINKMQATILASSSNNFQPPKTR